MSLHEKTVLTAATDKTADTEKLSEMTVAHVPQKSNKNFSGSGGNAAPGYSAINGEELMILITG